MASELAKAIDAMHEDVAANEASAVDKRISKEGSKPGAHQFQLGDFVLVVSTGNAQHVAKRHKASTTWQGPYEVVDA